MLSSFKTAGEMKGSLYPWLARHQSQLKYTSELDTNGGSQRHAQIEREQRQLEDQLRQMRADVRRAKLALQQADRFINLGNGNALYF